MTGTSRSPQIAEQTPCERPGGSPVVTIGQSTPFTWMASTVKPVEGSEEIAAPATGLWPVVTVKLAAASSPMFITRPVDDVVSPRSYDGRTVNELCAMLLVASASSVALMVESNRARHRRVRGEIVFEIRVSPARSWETTRCSGQSVASATCRST